MVSWDQVSSSNGPSQFLVLVSTDQVNYTVSEIINVFANGSLNGPTPFWTSQTYTTNTHYSLTLAPSAFNQPVVAIRVADSSTSSAGGGTVQPAGTDRIDNFTVLGQPAGSPGSPTVNWTNPAAITYGTALDFNQLNASASVPGTFVYSPLAGTVPGVGTNTLTAVFTPQDTNDYNGVTNTVNLLVQPALLTVTANSTNRPYGQPNPVFNGVISGLVNHDTIAANFTCAATTNSPPGMYPIVAALLDPFGRAGNYSVTTNNGTLTISPAAVSSQAYWPMRQRDIFNTGRSDYVVPANRMGSNFFTLLSWQKQSSNSPTDGALGGSTMVFYDGVGPGNSDIVAAGYHWPKGIQGMDRHTGKLFWSGLPDGGELIAEDTASFFARRQNHLRDQRRHGGQ